MTVGDDTLTELIDPIPRWDYLYVSVCLAPAQKYVEAQLFGIGRTKLKCMHMSGCDGACSSWIIDFVQEPTQIVLSACDTGRYIYNFTTATSFASDRDEEIRRSKDKGVWFELTSTTNIKRSLNQAITFFSSFAQPNHTRPR